jgi:hypothetical protein
MTPNVGILERRVRGAVGIFLLAFALLVELPGWWDGVPGVIGAVLLLTAIVRYCPINAMLGRRSL